MCDALTLVLVARIPAAGTADFQAYEAAVLPLLADHGGRLERRLRTADAGVEVHIVVFPSRAALDSYRSDPRRAGQAPLLQRSGAALELLEVVEVRDSHQLCPGTEQSTPA
jgi:hypothetical protein